jgi:D-glycero-D-manno-heptose 1,7-bisphosphate phosphatase
MPLRSAVFLDRDGVINAPVRICGEIDSPLLASQVKLLPRVGEAVRLLNDVGFPVVVVSNQPVVAKGKTSAAELESITASIRRRVARQGGVLDAIYYCLHHPQAALAEFRTACECRKPAPGLLLKAARELELDLSGSFMVGDRLTDIQAAKAAGCASILVGRPGGAFHGGSETGAARPDCTAADLYDAVQWIVTQSGKRVRRRQFQEGNWWKFSSIPAI